VSAIATILFNTVLACIKDAFGPLEHFMAQLTGHHWTTQGLADVALFLLLGVVLMLRSFRVSSSAMSLGMVAATVVGGGGLLLWFVLV
jgi:hypothetical protein